MSSLTRNGPDSGREEGRVIASAGSINVRSRTLRRRAILALAAVPLFLVAMWVRTPTLSRSPVAPSRAEERASAAAGAVRALERAVGEAIERLDARAAGALDAPPESGEAFTFLAFRSPQRDGESVVLYEAGRPFAWAGSIRVDADSVRSPITVVFSEFYSTLNIVRERGSRRAVASAVLQAHSPADNLTQSLASRVALSGEVESYALAPGSEAGGGEVVLSASGVPLLRATARLAPSEE
ncbi:MAG: hypothetical protein M3365_11670, partial [Gemmatimonadota bacterium]|nr:hypothetical protein [Gemmatimonadota bacterium]